MDGRPLFDLSQLLEYYHKEKEATEATLKKIPDRFIRVRIHCVCVLYLVDAAKLMYGKGRQKFKAWRPFTIHLWQW